MTAKNSSGDTIALGDGSGDTLDTSSNAFNILSFNFNTISLGNGRNDT